MHEQNIRQSKLKSNNIERVNLIEIRIHMKSNRLENGFNNCNMTIEDDLISFPPNMIDGSNKSLKDNFTSN